MSQAIPPLEAGANLAADTASALPQGARVAEFEIRGVLGSGGFGTVYRVDELGGPAHSPDPESGHERFVFSVQLALRATH